ncbi:hypothetical protein HanPSC8_Chr13g0569641 [Helianthus annuus]|nr:hypothetical protein HanPSC8_Chr13g0569641 [Helianthus annuus]
MNSLRPQGGILISPLFHSRGRPSEFPFLFSYLIEIEASSNQEPYIPLYSASHVRFFFAQYLSPQPFPYLILQITKLGV